MKITNQQLRQISEAAKRNFVNDSQEQLDQDQFVSKCYVKAVSAVLKVDVEFETRILVEPVEE